jgi:hypothetical protein
VASFLDTNQLHCGSQLLPWLPVPVGPAGPDDAALADPEPLDGAGVYVGAGVVSTGVLSVEAEVTGVVSTSGVSGTELAGGLDDAAEVSDPVDPELRLELVGLCRWERW